MLDQQNGETSLKMLSWQECFESILRRLPTDHLCFVIDENVWTIYFNANQEYLFSFFPRQKDQREISIWVAPAGEEAKTFRVFEECVDYFLEQRVHRFSHLVAIGGGATSDMAGMVAATLLRGIEWSILPTTLLSMVDAAIGGKVAINTRWGKNLLGQFHMPRLVAMDFQFLNSLSSQDMRSGKGEILKYAFLSPLLAQMLEENSSLESLILACAQFKNTLVQKDPMERGERIFLNWGHTFGHCFERLLPLSHGESVILGMEVILKYFYRGDCKEHPLLAFLQQWKQILQLDLSLQHYVSKLSLSKILDLLALDKKRKQLDKLSLILVEEIGHPYVQEFSWDEVKRALEEIPWLK